MRVRSAFLLIVLALAPPRAVARQGDAPRAEAVEVLDGPVAVYPEHLAGRRMASGTSYRPGDLVAAHPTLPFGTELDLEAAGRTVRVVVMDRGPYDANVRLLVSAEAGARLGLGEEPRWTRIRRAGAPTPPGSQDGSQDGSQPPTDDAGWTVQLGSFSDRLAADRLAARFSGARVEPGPGATWRVTYGRFVDRAEADAWRERIAGWGVNGFVRPAGRTDS